MLTTDQMIFGRVLSNESLAAARYWNTPGSRSARKPAPELTDERSAYSSTGNSEREDHGSGRPGVKAHRHIGALANSSSQEHRYTSRNQWPCRLSALCWTTPLIED